MSKKKMILKKLKEMTETEAFRITPVPDKKPGLTNSKIGGMPYWDKTKEYPVSPDGEKLILLAQINLAELPANDSFPEKGILQFFISEMDRPLENGYFRVVFHPEINQNISDEDLNSLDIPTSLEDWDCFPVAGEASMAFEKVRVSMGAMDFHYDEMLREAARLSGENIPADEVPFDYLEFTDDECDSEYNLSAGHWLLGYPYFTQEDPRGCGDSDKFDTMLLQLDCDYKEGRGFEIMWGDCGVGNFFIRGEALAQRDFSEVLYSWDCC